MNIRQLPNISTSLAMDKFGRGIASVLAPTTRLPIHPPNTSLFSGKHMSRRLMILSRGHRLAFVFYLCQIRLQRSSFTLLVAGDQPVADADDAAGVPRDILFVCHDDQGIAFVRQLLEQSQDFDAGLGVEVP